MEYYAGLDVSLKEISICVVDEDGTVLHLVKLFAGHHSFGFRRLRNVQTDNVCRCEELAQAICWFNIAVTQLVCVIIVDHAHAHGLGQVRELGTNVSITNNAESLAPDLMALRR